MIVPQMGTPDSRREQLKQVYEQARNCRQCNLAETRTTVPSGTHEFVVAAYPVPCRARNPMPPNNVVINR